MSIINFCILFDDENFAFPLAPAWNVVPTEMLGLGSTTKLCGSFSLHPAPWCFPCVSLRYSFACSCLMVLYLVQFSLFCCLALSLQPLLFYLVVCIHSSHCVCSMPLHYVCSYFAFCSLVWLCLPSNDGLSPSVRGGVGSWLEMLAPHMVVYVAREKRSLRARSLHCSTIYLPLSLYNSNFSLCFLHHALSPRFPGKGGKLRGSVYI